jgi:F-type H+-transporting ATPase subunit epsilon
LGLTVLAETAIDLVELDAEQLAQAIKDTEEDVADAAEDAQRDSAQTKLDQLRQVQATLNL